MEPTPSLSPPPQSPGPNLNAAVASLQRQCRELRTILFLTLGTLILISLGMNFFFVRQWRSLSNQLVEQRSVRERFSNEYRTVKEPRMKAFLAQLHRFAATHQDFQPLLEKYRPFLEAHYPPSLAPAVSPASGSPPPPVAPQ